MSQQSRHGTPDPRSGPLGRLTAVVYWFLVVEGCFLLAAAPGFVGLLLLERDASNIPLFALCLVPVAPAFLAAMATLQRRASSEELVVWPVFWRLWWRNLGDVLRLWVPTLVVLAVLTVNLVQGPTAGVGGVYVVGSGILAGGVLLWAVMALVIATFFVFRIRDAARLGAYYLGARPLVTLGILSFLVIVVATIAFTSDWVAALAGSLLAAFLLLTVQPVLTDVRERFVEDPPA